MLDSVYYKNLRKTKVMLLFQFVILINTARLIYSNNEVYMRAKPHITPNDKS